MLGVPRVSSSRPAFPCRVSPLSRGASAFASASSPLSSSGLSCVSVGAPPPRFGGCRVVQNRKNNKKARSVLMRVGWDPEGLLSAPQGGHISRRQIHHARQEDEKLDAELKERAEKEMLELEAAREARVLPAEGEYMELMDFLTNLDEGELEYEMVRCRPLITAQFLDFLKKEVTTQKLSATDDIQGQIAGELEAMYEVLSASAERVDVDVATLAAPAERLRALLSSPDKKAHILTMMENNEIDKPLIDLLNQNVHAARAAGQDDAAAFMEKVGDALNKYLIK
ncbi:hypothetical protein PPROV_000187100 [Pycnococcus provasolii]|uniref:Uncharacterized protein n=2 Tax=Pycnococcus provasolii TaxID=41880 RepID=A0A830H7C2_9CHLO|nr:hypothetical protein PPROV_000187100 [Pycnococcus provasolii]